jgi:hypothetical protein
MEGRAMTPEIQKLIDDTNAAHEAQLGHSRLWGWFGLSRASFLVVPRVMMHAMPDDWQKRIAVLLEEYEEAFPRHPDTTCNVQRRTGNKFTKWPEWLLNYRRPDQWEIDRARGCCPVCSGDCAGANPPVISCPMKDSD